MPADIKYIKTARAEFYYNRFAVEYSKRNWYKDEPSWNELSEETQNWWVLFVRDISTLSTKEQPI